jgi:hypothetical protein
MPESRAREAIEILKASLEESPTKARKVPQPAPRKATKTAKKVKKPRFS